MTSSAWGGMGGRGSTRSTDGISSFARPLTFPREGDHRTGVVGTGNGTKHNVSNYLRNFFLGFDDFTKGWRGAGGTSEDGVGVWEDRPSSVSPVSYGRSGTLVETPNGGVYRPGASVGHLWPVTGEDVGVEVCRTCGHKGTFTVAQTRVRRVISPGRSR